MVTFWDSMILIVYGLYQYFSIRDHFIHEIGFFPQVIYITIVRIFRYCGIWHLSVTALERMCFVVWPTNPAIRRASVKEAVIISFGFILFAVFLSCIHFSFKNVHFRMVINGCLLLLFAIALPFIILLSSSFTVLYKLNKNMRRINPFQNNPVNVSTLLSIKMVIVVSVYYILTTSPLIIFGIIGTYFYNNYIIYYLNRELPTNIFNILWVSNGSMKFYLYTIFIPHLRKEFLNICKKIISKMK